MAVNFPSNPTIGQQVVGANNVVYEWDGEKWKSANNIGPSLFGISSGVPPSGASNGDAWFDTESGRAYVYYIDDDSAQWIDMSPTWNGTITDGSVTPEKLSSGGPSWTASGDFSVDTNTLYVDATNNRVGIGTTAFDAGDILHVAGTGDTRMKVSTSSTSAGHNAAIRLDATTNGKYTIQTGADTSGGLRVFDNNGSAERCRIDSSGRLLVGTSSSRSGWFNSGTWGNPTLQVEGTSVFNSGISVTNNSNDDNGSQLILGKSRATSVGGVTVVSSGDNLGRISFQGADGTELVAGATIEATVDGSPGANDLPSRLVFSTTADGASSPTERMRVDSAGRVTMPYQPAFLASSSAGNNNLPGNTVIPFNILNTTFASSNRSAGYSTSTYAYTAPVAGLYLFGCTLFYYSGTWDGQIVWRKNGAQMLYSDTAFAFAYQSPAAVRTLSGSVIIELAATDFVQVANRNGGGTINYYGGHSAFWGVLIG